MTILAALMLLLPLIDSGETIARWEIDKAVGADCDAMIFVLDAQGDVARDEDGYLIQRWPGAFCAWQMTDITHVADVVRARVQISVGCEGVMDLSTAQETERWYSVRLTNGEVIERTQIEVSPHLIRNGTWVREFSDPECA